MQVGSKFPTLAGFKQVPALAAAAPAHGPLRVIHPDPQLVVAFAPLGQLANDWYSLEVVFPSEGLVDVTAQLTFEEGLVWWLRLPTPERNHVLAHVRLDGTLKQLTLTMTGSGRLAQPILCRFERMSRKGQFFAAMRRGLDIARRDGFGAFKSASSYFWRLTRPGAIILSRGLTPIVAETAYDTWMRVFDEAPGRDRERHEERLAALSRRPLISVLIALDATDAQALDRLALGLARQIYPAWELLLAAPASQQDGLRASLSAHGLDGARFRLIESRGAAAESLNALLAAARGDYILPFAAGTLLRPHALLDLALTVDRVPSAEAIYTDEDRIDDAGRRSDPRFKPAWSPDVFDAHDYCGSLKLLRCATVRALGGWRAETSAAHEHDLMLRLADAVAPNTIVHLAKVLSHGRLAGESVAPADSSGTLRALADAVARRGVMADATWDGTHALARLRYRVPAPAPRVSLIIPTRDKAALLATCIRSIRAHTHYPDYEIIIIDNGSVEETTKRLFAVLDADPAVRILPRPGPFNFSGLNNSAVQEATGSILGLINNDIEVIDEGWLDEMVALAARPQIGCVGAKLLYPGGRLQHGGVIVGLGGVAGHAHRLASGSDPGYLKRLCCVQDVSAVTAACLLVRRQVFDQVGGFDERLTVTFNDVDFCLKVHAAGYLNLWTPFAGVVHHESVSRGHDRSPAKARRFAHEYATMQGRWGADLLSDPYYSPHLTNNREDFSIRQ